MVINTIYFQSGTEPGVQEGIPAEREGTKFMTIFTPERNTVQFNFWRLAK